MKPQTAARVFVPFGLLFTGLLLLACARFRQGNPVQPAPAENATVGASSAPSSAGGIAGTIVSVLDVGGTTRSFRLHVPPGVTTHTSLPLVLNFHGFGSNAEQEERFSGMSALADTKNFVVAYPEGSGSPQRWNLGPGKEGHQDLAFVRAMLDEIERNYPIDRSRIYVTGISNGAQMTDHLACEMSDVFAAAAAVAGGYFRGEVCQPAQPVPYMEFHGTADHVLPYTGQGDLLLPVPDALARWAQRNGCDAQSQVFMRQGQAEGEQWGNCRNGADVVLYTVNGGGHSWPGSPNLPRLITTQDINATAIMWDFFSKHTR